MAKDTEGYFLSACFGFIMGVILMAAILIPAGDRAWESRIVDKPEYIEAVRQRVLAERLENKTLQNKQ